MPNWQSSCRIRTPQITWPLLQRGNCAARAPRAALALLRSPSVAVAALHTRAALDTRKINKLIIDVTGARELLGLYEQHGTSFNDVNFATCWSRLGRVRGPERTWLRSDDGTRLLALREQTTDQVRTLGARELSNTAHAIAKLDFRGAAWRSIWKDLEGAALARRSEFEPQALANLAWAFATAGRATHALLDAVAEESAGRVREFNPRTWPTRRGRSSRPAMPPRRSSTRLERSLQGGCVS